MAGDNSGKTTWITHTLTAAMTLVMAGTIAWFSGAREWVTRDEMRNAMEKDTPYVRERDGWKARDEYQTKSIDQLAAQVNKLVDSQSELVKQVSVLVTKLEQERANRAAKE